MTRLSRSSSRFLWFIMLSLCILCLGLWTQKISFGLISYTWPTSTATILESRGVKTRLDSDDAPSYGVRAKYLYQIQGARYTNDVIRFTLSDGAREPALQMLRHLPKGRTVPVRYNPNNPQTATLLPGIEKASLIVLAGLAFVTVVCLMGLLFGWRWHSRTGIG